MAPVDPAATLPPLCAGLLVGGASTRMGRDKPLIVHAGAPLLARVCAAVTPHCRTVVLLGNHAVAGFEALPRIADAPNLAGPAAGMLAAARHDPAAAWLIVSCDLPLICADAVAWLVSQRAGGRTAVLPRVASQVEPLFAIYEPRALARLAELAAHGTPAPHRLAEFAGAFCPAPPAALQACWTNVNTPAELAALPPPGAPG